MMYIIIAVVVLGIIGLLSALILFGASKKFAVEEDPRVGQVQEVLPGANCGGCGFAGCVGFAEGCVKGADAGSLDGLYCNVGGEKCMKKISDILGVASAEHEPMVAVVRCNGTCENRPRTAVYDGRMTCANVAACGAGETGCGFGCMGMGDCVNVCPTGAITVNATTGIAEVNEDLCNGCGACSKICPRGIIEVRKKGPKNRRVFVCCVNKDKGPVAKKACTAACIGCSLCVMECQFEAITMENNCSYIDFNKCRLCKKCVEVCPTHAIHAVNFPVKKEESSTKG
ncbi:MAG: RnfABCDGE type electron transport complex subunit B [Prevotella sp.]|nr:RnfABCDGE type electron transport complex subunit B [Candidatus Equicola stercoris]